MDFYIAYGSNLNTTQMAYRCPGATPAAIAYLQDYRLSYKGSKTGAYLTIDPAEGCCVPVVIWQVTKYDEMNLDIYEGYPNFYDKERMQVVGYDIETGAQKEYNAFVYRMVGSRKFAPPSPFYIKTCADGYWEFDFPKHYLDDALAYTMEMVAHDSKNASMPTMRKTLPR